MANKKKIEGQTIIVEIDGKSYQWFYRSYMLWHRFATQTADRMYINNFGKNEITCTIPIKPQFRYVKT